MKPVGYAFQKNMFTAQEVAEWCAGIMRSKNIFRNGGSGPGSPCGTGNSLPTNNRDARTS